jgi:hypothetical protein
MEWWSNGVMKKQYKLRFGLLLLPTLQYSSTPILQKGSQYLPAKPLNSDLAVVMV